MYYITTNTSDEVAFNYIEDAIEFIRLAIEETCHQRSNCAGCKLYDVIPIIVCDSFNSQFQTYKRYCEAGKYYNARTVYDQNKLLERLCDQLGYKLEIT